MKRDSFTDRKQYVRGSILPSHPIRGLVSRLGRGESLRQETPSGTGVGGVPLVVVPGAPEVGTTGNGLDTPVPGGTLRRPVLPPRLTLGQCGEGGRAHEEVPRPVRDGLAVGGVIGRRPRPRRCLGRLRPEPKVVEVPRRGPPHVELCRDVGDGPVVV